MPRGYAYYIDGFAAVMHQVIVEIRVGQRIQISGQRPVYQENPA